MRTITKVIPDIGRYTVDFRKTHLFGNDAGQANHLKITQNKKPWFLRAF
ncbi:MAG: hypothetical protein HXX11_13890 [Desulfuromonadales bacterium]|nr:hypothetical protein [Desulfuromonadales bacterium]